jgi:hypothetical protein
LKPKLIINAGLQEFLEDFIGSDMYSGEREFLLSDEDGVCTTVYFRFECVECRYEELIDGEGYLPDSEPKPRKCKKCGKKLMPILIPNVDVQIAELLDTAYLNLGGGKNYSNRINKILIWIDDYYIDGCKTKEFIDRVKQIRQKYKIIVEDY